ncbi:hypothetical protein ACIA8R_38310 [Nonomuraea sp. NPDC051191]|uniref:hypothetical protein n=1 Tax=Nonomuraea sp. NPDC051191 TaxID=3364372 RepID=UPI0037AE5A8B
MASAVVQTLLEEVSGAPAKHVELIFQPELVVRAPQAPDRWSGRIPDVCWTGGPGVFRTGSGSVVDR